MEGLNATVPLISILLGALAGLLSSIIISLYNQKQSVKIRIIEQYFIIRKELCQKLSDLANLRLEKDITNFDAELIINDISKSYYTYYDFLPEEVLRELNCLYACISEYGDNLYHINNDGIEAVNDEHLERFLETTSLIRDYKYYAYAKLHSADIKAKKSITINLQARHVLAILNKHFTLQNLLRWTNHLRKSKNF